jgi:hypothetical protein
MRKVNIAAYGKRILPHHRWAMDALCSTWSRRLPDTSAGKV